MKLKLILIAGLLLNQLAYSQTEAESYTWPVEPGVRENLEKWRDMKFGVLISWGLYSQKGILESWGLCPEDEDWIGRNGYPDYFEYARDYRNTKALFNPLQFDPETWAENCKAGGVKYMIFVTKHHDGFCMFDSKYTDFRITHQSCPFSVHPRANVTAEIFDAFREQGLSVGAYYSKPDWGSEYFWWPYFPPKDRNPNYDITKHPERWKQYIDFTRNQLDELVTEYGKLDILWLDGCWVRPLNTINKKVEEFCRYPFDMDINMKAIAENARSKQPGILVVDRWVPGRYENYLTPEQKTPEEALQVPWESCITMATDWGWTPHAKYKSSRELVQLLVNIVAKGGNLLLGIGPDGNGNFDAEVYQRLNEVGNWLRVNGEAIYGSRPVAPFKEGNIAYTAKSADTTYAICLTGPTDVLPEEKVFIRTEYNGKLSVKSLDTHQSLKYKHVEDGIIVYLPQKLRESVKNSAAYTIRVSR